MDVTSLQEKLQKDVAKIFFANIKKEFGLDEDLFSYGIDSVRQAEITDEINNFFHIDVNPVVFVRHDTINKFCEYLLENHHEELIKYYNNHN